MTEVHPGLTGPVPTPHIKERRQAALIRESHPSRIERSAADWYGPTYNTACNIAYLITGSQYEAETVANKVMDELQEHRGLPSKEPAEEDYVRVLAWRRALDCTRSPMHRFMQMCRSLIQQNEEGEEYCIADLSHAEVSAEEEVLAKEDEALFAQRYAQALSRLSDKQRICFVLRLVEELETCEIAEILDIPPEDVSEYTRQARKRIRAFLKKQQKTTNSCSKKERRPI